jgi:hypothetical protein
MITSSEVIRQCTLDIRIINVNILVINIKLLTYLKVKINLIIKLTRGNMDLLLIKKATRSDWPTTIEGHPVLVVPNQYIFQYKIYIWHYMNIYHYFMPHFGCTEVTDKDRDKTQHCHHLLYCSVASPVTC